MKGREFTSASSNSFLGYSCYFDGLKIGDIQIKRFYCYIAFNDTSKALLGDDFISCCIFNHGFKNDIIVTAFNFDEYEKQYLHSAGLMDIFEVFSLN